MGKYFVSCIHFAMIHQTSPVGLTNQLHYWWGGDFEAPSLELALKFQEMAWKVVNEYPKSCMNTTTANNNESEKHDIKIWPNPTSYIFSIEGLSDYDLIQVLDMMGIYGYSTQSIGTKIDIIIQELPAGLYNVRIKSKNSNHVVMKKLIRYD